jgi:hypothetical protein
MVEQIVDETLAELGQKPGFGPETVEELRRVFAQGNLGKPDRVVEALQLFSEEGDEGP